MKITKGSGGWLSKCHGIQSRRVAAGRKGYAKAVRKMVAKEEPLNYQGYLARLPVSWS